MTDAMPGAAAVIDAFVQREKLPGEYGRYARECFVPLAERVAASYAGKTLCVGIHGAQGTGKSTLAGLLAALLKQCCGRSVAELSLDDLYLTRAARMQLAADVHPLLATRGVPGTHDVGLGREVLHQLAAGKRGVRVPRFAKSVDDRVAPADWPVVKAPVDIVMFEGWCVSTPPQREAELTEPVNELERSEDAGGDWRRYVNTQLAGPYQELFAAIDLLVMLQAPDFDCVYNWRRRQEQALVARTGVESPLLQGDGLARFIAHYERLTRHNLQTLPALADCVIALDPQQAPVSVLYQRRLAD